MKNKISIASFLLSLLITSSLFMGCKQDNSKEIIEATLPKSITVSDGKFVDNLGRQVILNGINVISKSKEQGYLVNEDSTLYARLRDWGFNSVRFGIIWDGIEPEPGVYNEAYLEGIGSTYKAGCPL